MSDFSAAEIDHLAELARIALSPEEKAEFTQELPKIVEFVEHLRGVKLDDDLKGSEAVDLKNMRKDEVSGARLTLEQLQALAPNWQDGQVVVPAVFGEAADE